MSNQKKEIFAPYVEVGETLPTHGDKVVFRDEQNDAIDRAYKHLSKSGEKRKFLWNAKMRFGKTICALELVRKLDAKATLIVTHRPVVDKGWREDFDKVFKPARLKSLKADLLAADKEYKYGSHSLEKEEGLGFSKLTTFAKTKDGYGIYFVSMQYLALAEIVGGGNTEKQKRDILEFPWDMVIVDEAHEGTQTERGKNVLKMLAKPTTKMLHLSGTPFNLYDDFDDDEVYTWDYVMEQTKKEGWTADKGPNPYLTLPKMNIFTYNLGRLVVGEEATFTFAEFFRTKSGSNVPVEEQGKFVHEDWVKKFLDKLCEKSDTSNYPFSTDEYRHSFRHTLWVLPGVKEAKALEELLKKHWVFKNFEIVNVAGEKDDDEARDGALEELRRKITNPLTITLSCGRLTTGVTVPEWTAVFYLKGSENTSASTYMQTIFRTQSPYVFEENGIKKYKANCYVFDFAPDRSLRMLAETAKFSTLTQDQKKNAKNVGTDDENVQKMEDFLKFCPVISLDGQMKEFDAERLFTQLNQVYIDRVVRSGFNDNCLYDVQALLDLDVDNLNALSVKIAESTNLKTPPKAKRLPADIQMAKSGLKGKGETSTGDDDQKEGEDAEEKKRKKARRDERKRRIEIIRGIAQRVPLMMYGAEVKNGQKITRDNFTTMIEKNEDWEEFMPRGVTRDDFNKIKAAFSQTIFDGAGERILHLAREADKMTVTERIKRITEIFGWLKNPDKETVLTPWPVVNMHMSDTIGGYCFLDETFDEKNPLGEPRFVNREGVTDKVFFHRETDKGNPILRSKILEINSKTGLYPLYVAYTLFRARKADFENLGLIEDTSKYSVEEEHAIWDDILLDNIYVICNTEMAARITKRTLVGFRELDESRLHIKHMKLVEEATKNQGKLVKELKSKAFWSEKGEGEMKFNAIVGNPPYHQMTGGDASGSDPIYNQFIDVGMLLSDKGTLIHPGRFLFRAGKTPKDWNEKILSDAHYQVVKYFPNSGDVFTSVDIKGGVAITYWDKAKKVGPIGVFVSHEQLRDILKKVKGESFESFADLVYARTVYRLDEKLYEENPWAEGRQSKGHRLDMGSNLLTLFPELFTEESSADDDAMIYGLVKTKRAYRYVKRSYISAPDNFNSYKVILPAANGSGALGEVLSTPVVVGPSIGHTETFLSIGKFKRANEANACLKYVKSKFARTLLATLKITHHNIRETWSNVPLQDFAKTSDIDWTKSISEIDQQLYKKYKLTKEEIAFIESMIKPME